MIYYCKFSPKIIKDFLDESKKLTNSQQKENNLVSLKVKRHDEKSKRQSSPDKKGLASKTVDRKKRRENSTIKIWSGDKKMEIENLVKFKAVNSAFKLQKTSKEKQKSNYKSGSKSEIKIPKIIKSVAEPLPLLEKRDSSIIDHDNNFDDNTYVIRKKVKGGVNTEGPMESKSNDWKSVTTDEYSNTFPNQFKILNKINSQERSFTNIFQPSFPFQKKEDSRSTSYLEGLFNS